MSVKWFLAAAILGVTGLAQATPGCDPWTSYRLRVVSINDEAPPVILDSSFAVSVGASGYVASSMYDPMTGERRTRRNLVKR